jgi:hypothetical protein
LVDVFGKLTISLIIGKTYLLKLGEMANLHKVNLPKSQPKHKMTKSLWLMFFGKLAISLIITKTALLKLGEMVNLHKVNLPKSQQEHNITKML